MHMEGTNNFCFFPSFLIFLSYFFFPSFKILGVGQLPLKIWWGGGGGLPPLPSPPEYAPVKL